MRPADYCSEAARLSSFAADWPHPDSSTCSRANMAKAGFYYTGPADCVKCFVCHIKLQGWDNDEPWSKHEENCIFARLRKDEDLLTIDQWIDICCEMAINKVDKKYSKLSASKNIHSKSQ